MANQSSIVKASLFTPGLNGRWGLPLIAWGEPGVAKSGMIRDIAHECGLGFNSTIASICEPADLAGYPIPNEERTMVNALPPPWIHKVNAMSGAVQLFDEATSCSNAAHAALMRITLEGKAGDVDVNPRVRFMMAANPVDCAANAQELAIPLANRFGHLQWDPGDARAWVEWLLSGSEDNSPPVMSALAREKLVMEAWPEAFADAKGLVGAFISERGSVLHKMPLVDAGESSLAWPSRRTWEMATRAYAGGLVNGLTPAERHLFVTAFIGQGPAGEFIEFVKNVDLPKALDVLAGKVKFTHAPVRLDRTMAVLSSCAAYILSTHTEEGSPEHDQWLSHVDAYWALCLHVTEAKAAELIIPSAKMMVLKRWDTRLFAGNKSNAFAVMSRIEPLITKVIKVA
ncbi:MAG: hypothetical protein COA94_06105 [Rickettsiales bacterium]|nr:MAG: hypothetical protein COA94_06105 [Rickettsiales bacterium]